MPSAALYHDVRAIVSNGSAEFAVPQGGHWRTATIERRDLEATIQIRPATETADPFLLSPGQLAEWQERMARHVMAMDDGTADVLDAICAAWLDQAAHPKDDILISADDLLKLRGLRPKLGGAGRRGGYYGPQRRAIAEQIAALRDTWVTVARMPVIRGAEGAQGRRRRREQYAGESPVLVVEFRAGPAAATGVVAPEECTAWVVRPGLVFAESLLGPGRETALLARRALEYDPYRRVWEKRLARYLSWLWRIRQSRGDYAAPISVRALLEAVRETVSRNDPSRTKERLERALDLLERDGVVGAWQYDSVDFDESIVGARGWARRWLDWKVVIEPPAEVVAHYATIEGRPRRRTRPRQRGGGGPLALVDGTGSHLRRATRRSG